MQDDADRRSSLRGESEPDPRDEALLELRARLEYLEPQYRRGDVTALFEGLFHLRLWLGDTLPSWFIQGLQDAAEHLLTAKRIGPTGNQKRAIEREITHKQRYDMVRELRGRGVKSWREAYRRAAEALADQNVDPEAIRKSYSLMRRKKGRVSRSANTYMATRRVLDMLNEYYRDDRGLRRGGE